MYGRDFRWRAVTLVYAYGVPTPTVARILGVSERAVRRWYQQFLTAGHVMVKQRGWRASYPPHVVEFISTYVTNHPCFFVEELQAELKGNFGGLELPLSHATILRTLRFDLKLSRKVLERRAKEAVIATYRAKLDAFYSYPEQLLFVDETSKKGTGSMRKYAWAPRGKKRIVKIPFRKGNRLSVVGACDTRGFVAWSTTKGTFTRRKFHDAFVTKFVSHLNPWPLPRSIVVLDNTLIHMYAELEHAIKCGALLLYLPPYCPHLIPIEILFGRLKKWLVWHANLRFP